jgi:hypothetical protein
MGGGGAAGEREASHASRGNSPFWSLGTLFRRENDARVQRIPLPEYRPRLDNDVEFKIRRPSDGQILDIHSLAEYNPAKRTVFGVINDVTQRKKAEEEIKSNLEELKRSKTLIQQSWQAPIILSFSHYITDPADRNNAKRNFDRALSCEHLVIVEAYGDNDLERQNTHPGGGR